MNMKTNFNSLRLCPFALNKTSEMHAIGDTYTFLFITHIAETSDV